MREVGMVESWRDQCAPSVPLTRLLAPERAEQRGRGGARRTDLRRPLVAVEGEGELDGGGAEGERRERAPPVECQPCR